MTTEPNTSVRTRLLTFMESQDSKGWRGRVMSTWMSEAVLMLAEEVDKLNGIESGEPPTVKSTTPTCVSTGDGNRRLLKLCAECGGRGCAVCELSGFDPLPPEPDITPEMVEAGTDILFEKWNKDGTLGDTVTAIHRAMEAVR